jgi:hypothetical protein
VAAKSADTGAEFAAKGQAEFAIQNLEALEKAAQNPEQMASILRYLLGRFPDSAPLRAFASKRMPQLVQTTLPEDDRLGPGGPQTRPGTRSAASFPWE